MVSPSKQYNFSYMGKIDELSPEVLGEILGILFVYVQQGIGISHLWIAAATILSHVIALNLGSCS